MSILVVILAAIFLGGIAPAFGLYAYIFNSFINFIIFIVLFSIGLSVISFLLNVIIAVFAGISGTVDSIKGEKRPGNTSFEKTSEEKETEEPTRKGNLPVNIAGILALMGFIPNIGILFGILAIGLGIYSAAVGTDYKLGVFFSIFMGIVSLLFFMVTHF